MLAAPSLKRQGGLAVLLGGAGMLVLLASILAPALYMLIVVGALVLAAGLILSRTPSHRILNLGVAFTVFADHSSGLGLPISPHRALIPLAFAALFLEARRMRPARRLRLRPIHVLLGAALAYAGLSGAISGSLSTTLGLYSWVDQFGVLPFAFLILAPYFFYDRGTRTSLLITLTALGLYLSVTAFFEISGLGALVFPHYIVDPSVGYQPGRARGPFTESVAEGMALFQCGVAASVLSHTLWTPRRAAAIVSATVAVLCGGAIVLTLTRAVWFGAVAGIIVAMASRPALRRKLPAALAVGTVAVGLVVFAVPGLQHKLYGRTAAPEAQYSVWDRYNTDEAAVRVFKQHPALGLGWKQFESKGFDQQVQAANRPITYRPIDVHNVPLGYLAELGAVGFTLWALAALMVFGTAVLRPGLAELRPWRVGLIAIAVDWLVVVNFGPAPYPFPNQLLWLWAGVVLVPYLSDWRVRTDLRATGSAANSPPSERVAMPQT